MRNKEKKEKKFHNIEDQTVLNIPDDEIWTYQIEGLAAPRIKKEYSNYRLKKILFSAVIIVAVCLSFYFSIRVVQKDTFEYSQLNSGTYEFVKFSNTGYIKELTVDYVTTIEYDETVSDPEKNFKLVKDETKPITTLHEYVFNCDNNLEVIYIGAGVTEIDGKSFYTCNNLRQIIVDENNPNYCDVDGVLYTKDMTKIICYPINHDAYLREKYGYAEELIYGNEDYTKQYRRDIQTYVVPSTVTTIGELCFNYANLRDVYLPEGLKTIETLAFFKTRQPGKDWEVAALENIYSYKSDAPVTDTHFGSLGEENTFSAEETEAIDVYYSLPEGLEYIGSDAFSYNSSMTYVYIPESVTHIGHHAFWDTVYKDGGALCGVSQMNVALDEETFDADVHTGDQWRPMHDSGAFQKTIETVYSAQRQTME